LILRNNIKIVATRYQILRLKCTKIDFGWGSAPDPLAGLRGPISKGREGKGGDEEGRGREEDREERREGRGGTPVCIFKFSLE